MAPTTEKEPDIAARTAVLETPELVEHILFHLPLVDLIRVKRVSKFFQNGIKASPKLQQHLTYFDSPVPASATTLWDAWTGKWVARRESRTHRTDTIIYHPLYHRCFQQRAQTNLSLSRAQMYRMKLDDQKWEHLPKDALIQQPPTFKIMVDLEPQRTQRNSIYGQDGPWNFQWWEESRMPSAEATNRSGIRLRDWDECLQACYKSEDEAMRSESGGGLRRERIVCRLWDDTFVYPPVLGARPPLLGWSAWV